jgi:hypothetical protein
MSLTTEQMRAIGEISSYFDLNSMPVQCTTSEHQGDDSAEEELPRIPLFRQTDNNTNTRNGGVKGNYHGDNVNSNNNIPLTIHTNEKHYPLVIFELRGELKDNRDSDKLVKCLCNIMEKEDRQGAPIDAVLDMKRVKYINANVVSRVVEYFATPEPPANNTRSRWWTSKAASMFASLCVVRPRNTQPRQVVLTATLQYLWKPNPELKSIPTKIVDHNSEVDDFLRKNNIK